MNIIFVINICISQDFLQEDKEKNNLCKENLNIVIIFHYLKDKPEGKYLKNVIFAYK